MMNGDGGCDGFVWVWFSKFVEAQKIVLLPGKNSEKQQGRTSWNSLQENGKNILD